MKLLLLLKDIGNKKLVLIGLKSEQLLIFRNTPILRVDLLENNTVWTIDLKRLRVTIVTLISSLRVQADVP